MATPVFKVGDQIRVISIPDSVLSMPPDMRDGPHGTLSAFQYVMAQPLPFTVVEIDTDFGWPWIEFEINDPKDGMHYHKLMIEPECVELISNKEP